MEIPINDEDEPRLAFIENHGHEHADTQSRARLVDDICENGPRTLTSTERWLVDRMLEEYSAARRNRRPLR